jgi:hypothetical protein
MEESPSKKDGEGSDCKGEFYEGNKNTEKENGEDL